MNELQPKRIGQTVFGENGNCMSACLAMLLGFEIAEIPNFFELGKSDREWWNALRNWLSRYNVGIITTNAKGAYLQSLMGYLIVSGESTRGLAHATVWKDGELWFDPHPQGNGLIEIEGVDLLYPLNPLMPIGKAYSMTKDIHVNDR